jgi:DNA polymerase I-like protein with 3'-5' exonuclease and polymerase domains
LGLDVVKRTTIGEDPALDRDTLTKLKAEDKSGIIERYIILSGLRKSEGMIRSVVGRAGELIHPQFNLGGKGTKEISVGGSPVTGRLSAQDPNTQQFPPWLRKYVISRFEKGVILKWDAAQIEIKVAYQYSGLSSSLKDLHQTLRFMYKVGMPRSHTRQEGRPATSLIYSVKSRTDERVRAGKG